MANTKVLRITFRYFITVVMISFIETKSCIVYASTVLMLSGPWYISYMVQRNQADTT